MRFVVATTALAVLTACEPPPLTEPSDAGGGQTDVALGADGSGGVEFTEVAGILRDGCTGSGVCHGDSASAGLEFPAGADSSDQQVREAIDGTTLQGEDVKFIVPDKPQESVLYQSLIPLNGRQLMPRSGRLPDDKIETIKTWIAQGAPYE